MEKKFALSGCLPESPQSQHDSHNNNNNNNIINSNNNSNNNNNNNIINSSNNNNNLRVQSLIRDVRPPAAREQYACVPARQFIRGLADNDIAGMYRSIIKSSMNYE